LYEEVVCVGDEYFRECVLKLKKGPNTYLDATYALPTFKCSNKICWRWIALWIAYHG